MARGGDIREECGNRRECGRFCERQGRVWEGMLETGESGEKGERDERGREKRIWMWWYGDTQRKYGSQQGSAGEVWRGVAR